METATLASPGRNAAAAAVGYRYQHGDRPLDGYTIQRGAGRGGFGEVYYALSDSGREVALKLVHTYEQIELRGIGQCMNLKSPHLVTVFDVKYGNDGRPWVIMEFVSGPSLRELLDAAPAGLGVQKAAFFLREIGKGLTDLHDCGIVHRDLKPANIFFENGCVKIGDYGLSKLISASQHSGQTMTVGTVHYMAPEIGAGRYDKGIDIYALGALLYEMLTGQVPYLGSSPAEVLMKHLSGSVDVSGIEEPFATVIRKSMAKDPADRYQTVQEMVEAVFGAEHIRNSVSHFSPDSLTIVAGQAARRIAPPLDGSFTPSDAPPPMPIGTPRLRFERRLDRMQRRVAERCGRAERRAKARWYRANARWRDPMPEPGADLFQRPKLDPMRFGQRIVIASIVAVLAAIAAAVIEQSPPTFWFVMMATGGATAALLLSWRFLAPGLRHESPWMTRIVMGGTAGIVSIVLTCPFWHDRGGHAMYSATSMAVMLSLLLPNWPARLSAARAERVRPKHVILIAIAAFALSAMFEGDPNAAIGAVVGTSLAVGLAAGWNPGALRSMPAGGPAVPPMPGAAPPIPPPPPVPAMPEDVSPSARAVPARIRLHAVPRGVRILWLVLCFALATLGLYLTIFSLLSDDLNHHGAVTFALGVGTSAVALFCYRRSTTATFASVWTYLVRPLIPLGCAQAILLFGSLIVACVSDDERIPPGYFVATIMPAVVLLMLALHRYRGGNVSYASVTLPAAAAPSRSSSTITLSGIGFGLIRFVSLVAGLVALAASLLLTVAVVSNLPGLWNSPVVDPRFYDEMTRQFGTRHWPELIRHIGMAGDFVLAMLATALLLMPRRGYGPAHMFRGLVAVGLALSAAVAFGRALPDWSDFIPSHSPAATIEMIFESIRLHGVFVGAGLLVLAAFVFLLPPRRRGAASVVGQA